MGSVVVISDNPTTRERKWKMQVSVKQRKTLSDFYSKRIKDVTLLSQENLGSFVSLSVFFAQFRRKTCKRRL